MAANSPKKKTTFKPLTRKRSIPSPVKAIFIHPAGTKLSDIYMDAPQVAQELNISKRTIRNMRVSEKLSFTTLFGKIFYYRQEIAAILAANKNLKKTNTPPRKK